MVSVNADFWLCYLLFLLCFETGLLPNPLCHLDSINNFKGWLGRGSDQTLPLPPFPTEKPVLQGQSDDDLQPTSTPELYSSNAHCLQLLLFLTLG